MRRALSIVLTFLVLLFNGNNGGESVAYVQDSKIQEGFNPGAVAADIDYGPYSGDQWARMFRALFTSNQRAEQGVLRGYRTELNVYNIGGTVFVEPGVGFCNGHFLIGEGTPDWSVAVTPPTAGHTRCDYVVMLENNTVGVYAPGAATMQTPNSADYGGIANQVPEFACRLAVIKGAEDAACPPAIFTQTTALWMVPLASIEWDVAQAIDTVTDLRHYIHEYTVTMMAPPISGYDVTTPTFPIPENFLAWPLQDETNTLVNGVWRVPPDYVRGLTVTPVIGPQGMGNLRAQEWLRFGSLGQSIITHNDDIALATYAIPAIVFTEPFTHTLTAAVAGDYMNFQFERFGTDVLDTLGAVVYFFGWKIEYTGARNWD